MRVDVCLRPQAVKRHHGIAVGACATLPMLIVGRLFKINTLPIFAGSFMSIGAMFLFQELWSKGRHWPKDDTRIW